MKSSVIKPRISSRTRSPVGLGLMLAAVFFAAGVLTLNDYGTTWDEAVSYTAGRKNLDSIRLVLGGKTPGEWAWQRIPGYQFVFDTARAASAHVANRYLFGPGSPLGFHLFNVLLASASLWLLFGLTRELTGRTRPAALALVALATFPKFLAHSQNNPKDSVGLFCFVLVMFLVARAASRPLASAAAAGLGVGLALASHVIALLVVPVSVVWLLAHGEGGWRRRFSRILGLGTIALPVAILCQPWLWSRTLGRLWSIVELTGGFQPGFDVLYLGVLYSRGETPWHYSLVLLFVATPLVAIACAVVGASRAAGARGSEHATQLALVWLGVVLVADVLAPSHYDGVRHILAGLPAVAILVAVGADRLWERRSEVPRVARLLVGGLLVAGGATLTADLVRGHPYHDAYLNEAARIIAPGRPERWVELEVWGAVHKEGAEWLAGHAEHGALVVVPIAWHCAEPYLRDDLRLRLVLPEEVEGPAYLMLMTRIDRYTPRLRDIEEQETPIFSVSRGRATYLRIYRLHASERTVPQRIGSAPNGSRRNVGISAVRAPLGIPADDGACCRPRDVRMTHRRG